MVIIGVAATGELPFQRGAHIAGREIHEWQCMQRTRCLIQSRRLQAATYFLKTPCPVPST